MNHIDFRLTKNEAIILFEFLSNLEKNVPQFQYPSEEVVLNNILVSLEKQLSEPFQIDYSGILSTARSELR